MSDVTDATVEQKTAETTKSVDDMAAEMLSAAKTSTKKGCDTDHRLVIPTDVMQRQMISQGVTKESLVNFTDALGTVTRAAHHATSVYLRERLKETKPEQRDDLTVRMRGDIVAKGLRVEVKMTGHSSGMSVPREGRPATPYENFGSSTTAITMSSQLNDQRARDSEDIRKAYDALK